MDPDTLVRALTYRVRGVVTHDTCAKFSVQFVPRVPSMNMDGPGSDAGADMKSSGMTAGRRSVRTWHHQCPVLDPRLPFHCIC